MFSKSWSDAARAELSRAWIAAFCGRLDLDSASARTRGATSIAIFAVARPKPKAASVSLSELLLAEQGQPCDATGFE